MISTGKCTFQRFKVVEICISIYITIRLETIMCNRGPDSIVNISFSYLNLFDGFQVLFNIM